jgi:hypothetical protein
MFSSPRLLVVGFIFLSLSAHAETTVRFDSGEQRVSVIELFTSEGCSSCPPADRWLNNLTGHEDLWKNFIPLAFHVDYWDYLGWKDPYSRAAYSQRQYQYRRQNKVRAVYTPGFIVNGREWRGWLRSGMLSPDKMQAANLHAQITDQTIKAKYAGKQEPMVLNVALLGFGINTPVTAGENADRNLRHEFVVLAHEQYSSTTPDWTVNLPTVASTPVGRRAIALWVNRPSDLTPIQATGGWLP